MAVALVLAAVGVGLLWLAWQGAEPSDDGMSEDEEVRLMQEIGYLK